MQVTIEEHPLLDAQILFATFPAALGSMPSPVELVSQLTIGATAPLQTSDEVRAAVRDLFRHAGYKPTGRGKPASEYLLKAAGQQKLGSINLAVDICNVVSLHSGLPISVVDAEKTTPPWKIGVAPAGSSYVFNPSGQTMDIGQLLCLFDAEGPCANGVKDSQRTKTSDATRQTLTVIWGTTALPGRATEAAAWYRQLLENAGAEVTVLAATAT